MKKKLMLSLITLSITFLPLKVWALELTNDYTLTENLTESITVKSGSNVILNLNGFDITNTNRLDTIIVENNATLTIEGTGNVTNSTTGFAAIYNNGTTTINGGNYSVVGYYVILQHGNMTIKSGEFTGVNNSSLIDNGYYDYGKNTNERMGYVENKGIPNPNLVIDGGTFNGGLNTVKNDDGGILTINGGTYTNTIQVPIFNVNVTTINGGKFNAPTGGDKTAIYNRQYDDTNDKGEITINNGTFNANYILETDGVLPGAIVINGGTFNNELGIINPTGQTMTVQINSGTFKVAPQEIDIPADKELVVNTDGTTSVVYKSADYTEVNQILEEISKIDLSLYTEETVTALNNVKSSIDMNKNITEQEEVNTMAQNLRKSINELLLKSEDIEVPKTVDSIVITNIIGIISFASLFVVIAYFKKKLKD